MDLSEYPRCRRRCHSNQGAERQDKFTKATSKSRHPPNKTNVLTSLSEPIINDYSWGNIWNGQHKYHHGNNHPVSLIHQRQFPDQTLVKSGNSLSTVTRKVGSLHPKYCDTANSSSVYGPGDIGICNSRKFIPSENIFPERWQENTTQVEIPKPNPKMVSRPEIRVLNESYVTSALAAEDDHQDNGKHRLITSKSLFDCTKSNGMEKIGQVSAAVPPAGSSTVAATWRNYQLGISNPVMEQDGNKFVENPGISYQKNDFANNELLLEMAGASREISMKLNKALKKYDGLDKIREKIKRQQLSCKENKKPEENHVSKVMSAGDDASISNGIQDVTNGNSHPIMIEEERPHSFVRMPSNHKSHKMADVEESERHVKVRKIATAVSSPSYKGFTDLKGKLHEKNTKLKKAKVKETKVDDQTNDKVLTSQITSDKCVEKTNPAEPASNRNKSHHKNLITPSSWREGQETIRRLLGPPKKFHATKPASVVANQEELNLEESKLTVGARQMLKDLQLGKNIEVNKNSASLVEEEDDKSAKEPKIDSHPEEKPLSHAVKRKPTKSKEPEKQAKVRHYDPEEVRKFMAKKKDERFRKIKEDMTSRLREGLKREKMLQEVYRKQKEATAVQRKEGTSSRCKSKVDLPKSTDVKEKPSSDIKHLVGGSRDIHFDDDTHSTLTIDSYDGSLTPIVTPIKSFPTAATLPMKNHSLNERTDPTKSTYPHPVISDLELNPTSLKNNHPTSAASSTDMLSYPAKSIPANIYSENIEMSHRRRIMDIHSSAATLTNKLRNIYKQSSATDLSVLQSNERYSPKCDILSGTGPTYVGTLLDDNLPGVLNLRLKAQEIFEKKEQDAATRIQAVYRGYMVRKNLKWQYLTGLPDIDSESICAFQPNFFQDQSDASSVNSCDLNKPPKFKSLFHKHLAAERHSVNPSHVPYPKEIKDYKRQPRSLTVYPKYPWEEDATTDQFSIVNIFASKYKNFRSTTDSDHSSENGIEKHIAKLHSPVTLSPVSSAGSNKYKFIPHPPPNRRHQRGCTEQTSDLAKPVKTDLHHEVHRSLENKNEESSMKAKEFRDVSSENDSNIVDGTRSKTSCKSASRRGTSARKKLKLYKVPCKSVDPDSHTDTSFPSFSEDSEIGNRSTSDAPLRSQSSLGNSTDSDVPNLLNEQTKTCASLSYPTVSSYSQHYHQPGKDAADLSTVKKCYAPSTLPLRLRAELYNFEQTVETVSLAQQGMFSLGQIFQNLEQTKPQERDYWDRLKREVNLLEEENAGPKSEMLENSEALISGEQSFSLKSITANEERKKTLSKHEPESLSTQTHTHTKDISRAENVNKPKISDSLYSHSEHSLLVSGGGGGGKYLKTSYSSSQTETKRRSHHKNGHGSSQHDSHSAEGNSSKRSLKTTSDFRGAEETSDSITEDISDGSNIEATSVSASIPEESVLSSKHSSNVKEAWKVQLEEEKQRAQKEDSIWQSKLKEVQEKLNSLQHPLVKKELDEVLPDLVKRKLLVFAEVPHMMAELERLTEKQESSRREHYQRVKSLLKSQAKIPERKSRRSKDHSKSDSEIYGQPISSKELGLNLNHGQKGHTSASKEKCLVEKKLEVQALEKRLQHEGKYLHKLKKETLKKYNEANADVTSLTDRNCSHASYSTSSIKEDIIESGEKQNSRRRLDNSSHPSDHSISEVFDATSLSLPTSFSTAKVDKVHFPVSDGSRGAGGVKSSVSEEIQEKWSQSSNGSKSKRPSSRKSNETSIAEDIENSTRRRNDDDDATSSYTKKTKPSASESGDDTATNDEYSRSFETSISSSHRASPVRRLPQPLVGTRNQNLPFKSSRCRLRGSESDTEDSFQSETLSDASDIEVRIRALSEDLKKKKLEADRLRQEKKAKYREKLKAQEESLLKQIEAYDNYIEEIKADLQKEQKSSNNKGVKPQIKQPKVSESRKFKQRSTTPNVSSVQTSKRDSTGSSADETQTALPLSPIKSDVQPETSICSAILSPRLQVASKGDNSKPQQLSISSTSPVASHVLSQNIQTELQSTKSAEIKSASIAEEIEEKTLSSLRSVSYSGIAMTANKQSPPSSKDILISVKVDLEAESVSGKSRQLNMKTDEKSPETEDQLNSEHLATDKSIQLASALSEAPTSICEKFEFVPSSSALSRSSDNDGTILKLNLKEEKGKDYSSSGPVNVESAGVKPDPKSPKSDNRYPTDLTSVSEQYSENFEVDNSTSSHHNLPSFCDDADDKKEDEISQFSLDKTVSDDEQEDEISEQISLHSDASERTSSSKCFLVSKSPRDEAEDQFSCSSHAHSLASKPCLDKEAPEERSSDLEVKQISEAALVINIEETPLQESLKDSTLQKSSQQIDNVVDEIFDKLVSSSVSTICKIATGKKETMANAKKAGPPVLPKPKRKTSPVKKLSTNTTDTTTTTTVTANEEEALESVSKITSSSNVLKESKIEEKIESKEKKQILHQKFTDDLMESLLVGSIKNALDIRRRRIVNSRQVGPATTSPHEIMVDEKKVTIRRGSTSEPPPFSLDEDPFLWSLSLDSDSSDDFSPTADNTDLERNVPRPHSPLPNEPKLSSPSDDIADKNIWPDVVPHQTPPPPYPGRVNDGDASLELHKLSEELYAVPQKRTEIDQLVSSAVDTLWQVKANNCSLSEATMPDCFLAVTDDLVSEMDQQSCRSYKKMLFDLTREIIEAVYEGSQDDDGNNNNNPIKEHSRYPMDKLVHRKCQPVINKYYRQSRSPPSTPEELQKVVQDAVGSLLHLENLDTSNGNTRKRQEFDKWNSSKKDHVDRVLIEELKEEEPHWVDYDDDVYELKVQLSNKIFDSLLLKTVETFKNIYNKRNERLQQQQMPL